MDLDDSSISIQTEQFNMIAAEDPKVFVPFGKIVQGSQDDTCSGAEEEFHLFYEDPATNAQPVVNEIYVKENSVVWSKGIGEHRELIASYTVQSPVNQAVKMQFYEHSDRPNLPSYRWEGTPPGEVLECICIRSSTKLETYATTGEQYMTWLPCPMAGMWPTKFGVLFEREPKENSVAPSSLWYSLIHPLEETAPVLVKKDPFAAQFISVPTENNRKIIFTSLEPSVCLTYHRETGSHCVWHIRLATLDESRGNNQVHLADCHDNSSALLSMSVLHTNPSLSRSFALSLSGSPFPPGLTSTAARKMKGMQDSTVHPLSPINQPLSSSLATPGSLNARYSMTPSPRRRGKASVTRSQYFSNLSSSSIKTQLDDIAEPILSEICLDFIWLDQLAKADQPSGEASKGFVASDLLGKTYICWLLKDLGLLRCVELKTTNEKRLFCCSPFSLPARDAVYLPPLKLLLTLDPGAEMSLTLYSASAKVAKVHVPITPGIASTGISMYLQRLSLDSDRKNLLSTPASAARIRRGVGEVDRTASPNLRLFSDSLTYSPIPAAPASSQTVTFTGFKISVGAEVLLTCSDGSCIRTVLPLLSSSPFVNRCLEALHTALPDDVFVAAAAKFYCVRNAPGAANISADEEWRLLESTLLQMMGFDQRSNSSAHTAASPELESKKRRRSHENGEDSDWDLLVTEEQFRTSAEQFAKLCSLDLNLPPLTKTPHGTNEVNAGELLFPFIPQILYCLHLLYEDCKLRTTSWNQAESLVTFLNQLSGSLSLGRYCDHYWRDFPSLADPSRGYHIAAADLTKLQPFLKRLQDPPSIYRSLVSFLLPPADAPAVKAYPFIENVNSLSKNLITLYAVLFGQLEGDEILLSNYLVAMETAAGEKVRLPSPFALRGKGRTKSAVLLMDSLRWTVAEIDALAAGVSLPLRGALLDGQREPGQDWSDSAFQLINRPDLTSLLLTGEDHGEAVIQHLSVASQAQREAASLDDNLDGMEDLDCGLLRLLFPNDLRVEDVRRLLGSSKPVTVTISEVQGLSEHELLEKRERQLLTLSARTMGLPVGRGMYTLHTLKPVPTETVKIPKLCLTGKSSNSGETVDLTHIEVAPNMSLWPQFHNGVAAGLRISADVEGIDSAWISYSRVQLGVSSEPTPEFSGFLFGLGLTGHLTKLSDVLAYDYISRDHEMTTLAILLGLGIARRGTQDPSTQRLISVHVEAFTTPSTSNFEEPHNVRVAALLSLGFLHQGSGNLHMTEVLLGEINRPPGPELENCVDRESYSLAAGLALGLVNLSQGGSMSVVDWLHHYMVGGDKRSYSPVQRAENRNSAPSFLIREGNKVNVQVTSPSATMALALMFLRTGNRIVAGWMTVPPHQKLLDAIRPDFLMLRVLTRGLILWDEVMPTKEWVESNIPENIRANCSHKPSEDEDEDIDYVTMYQTFYNVIAGACMAIGFKFAGSANADAFSTLFRYVKSLISLSGRSAAEWVGKSTVEACLNVLVLSLSLVMAGTGELEVLRLCRYLRMRTGAQNSAVTYGSHMATHMALGFLFLGGGKLTLSTSPEAVAALLCACFPVFPIHSNDNRCHLQALRHLYVLASEPRLLIPREIPSGRPCYTYVEVQFINGSSYKLKAPCVLPELKFLNSVRVVDERYWPVSYERSESSFDKLCDVLKGHRTLSVQLRVGRLSYLDDPDGFKSEIPLKSQRILSAKPEKIEELTTDPFIVGLCRFFFQRRRGQPLQDPLLSKIVLALYDSVVEERTVMIKPWLNLLQPMVNGLQLWQRKLLFALAQSPAATGFLFAEMASVLRKETETELLGPCEDLKQELKSYVHAAADGECRFTAAISQIASYFDLPRLPEMNRDCYKSPFGLAIELCKAGMTKKNALQIAMLIWK